jgi:NADPH-dependent ferric siderophore reductase
VVLFDGAAALYLERGGHSLQTLPALDDPVVAGPAFAALRALVEDGRFRELVVSRVDGEAVAASPWRTQMEQAGFVAGYRGHVLRPQNRRVIAAGRGLPVETAAADDYWRRGRSGLGGPGAGPRR